MDEGVIHQLRIIPDKPVKPQMQKTVETIQQSSKYPIDSMDGAGQFIIDIVGKSDEIDSNPISNLMVDQMTLG